MNKYFLTILIFLNGCVQLSNPQTQPVVQINVKERIFFTTCSGSVEDWATCFEKAKKSCLGDYLILQTSENPSAGRRELKFRCNHNPVN